MSKKIYMISGLFFLVLCLNLALSQIKSSAFETVSQSVIRLHIIANSDEKSDQELKLKVRDAIVSYMKEKAIDLENVNETRTFLEKEKNIFLQIAKNVLQANNCFDSVSVSLTTCHFPDKKYGNTIFPEGNYEAFQIKIGNANGHNWWCVLYPPLCFLEDSSLKEKETELSETDYEIRFKFLDFLLHDS